jgi:hypothetical protein
MLSDVLKLVAVALALLLLGQPIAACMSADQTMTAEEHNCCMKMASMCDASGMPTSHSCCKHSVSPQGVTPYKARNSEAALAVLSAEAIPASQMPMLKGDTRFSESPPESPPKISTVLRI